MTFVQAKSLIALVPLVLALGACTSGGAVKEVSELPAPAAAVQGLLELRVEGSLEVTPYAQFVSEGLAASLAEDDSRRKGEGSPIPEWATPQVTEEGTSTARVKVVWKPSDEDTAWPDSTTFDMELIGGKWKVVDASE